MAMDPPDPNINGKSIKLILNEKKENETKPQNSSFSTSPSGCIWVDVSKVVFGWQEFNSILFV